MTKKELFEICEMFRNVLDRAKKDAPVLLAPMNEFPHGCCGVTSRALTVYLCSMGVHAKFVSGVRPGESHAWVEVGQYILDITADQFDEIAEAVIVRKKSECAIHAAFRVDTIHSGKELTEMQKNNECSHEAWILECVNCALKKKEAGE